MRPVIALPCGSFLINRIYIIFFGSYLLFVSVFVINSYQRTAEGQYFTEGDEYGVVYLAQWWAEEARGEHYAAEAAQCHSDDKLQTFHTGEVRG